MSKEKTYEEEYEEVFFGGKDSTNDQEVLDEQGDDVEETEQNDEITGNENQEAEESALDDTAGEDAAENTEADQDGADDVDSEQADSQEESDPSNTPDEVEAKKTTIKWKGKEVEVSEEELRNLAQMGFDYTFKSQTLSKYKKRFEKMDEAGISDEDIELLSKVKAGDKEAMAYMMKQTGLDAYDVAEVENPKPILQNEDTNIVISENVKPLIEQIERNPELHNRMQQVEEYLPNAVINTMAQDANVLYGVVSEVESGSFDQVMPRLQMKLSSMSELDRAFVEQNQDAYVNLYIQTKNELFGNQQVQPQAPAQEQEVNASKPKKEKPNLADVGIKKSKTADRQVQVIKDAFSDDDEYHRILQRVRSQ
ncbi:hypothetical protein [Sulfurimonas sp.]|uniref:hypothetical protein n=1 Tax=Sulfurimonas sp. TaxID=2022749 RepID=UPI003565C0BD